MFKNITKYQIIKGHHIFDVDAIEFEDAIKNTDKVYIFIHNDIMRLMETDRVESAFIMESLHTPGAITFEK